MLKIAMPFSAASPPVIDLQLAERLKTGAAIRGDTLVSVAGSISSVMI
jgi:hypothetical protein